jgi:hypothetical protein
MSSSKTGMCSDNLRPPLLRIRSFGLCDRTVDYLCFLLFGYTRVCASYLLDGALKTDSDNSQQVATTEDMETNTATQ